MTKSYYFRQKITGFFLESDHLYFNNDFLRCIFENKAYIKLRSLSFHDIIKIEMENSFVKTEEIPTEE